MDIDNLVYIKKVNQKFATFIAERILPEPEFKPGRSVTETVTQYVLGSNLILNTDYGPLTSSMRRMFDVIRDFQSFWEPYQDDYFQALRLIDGTNVFTQEFSIPHATYFDTQILPLPGQAIPQDAAFKKGIEAEFEADKIILSIISIKIIVDLLPLLTANTDRPLVAFAPSQALSKETNSNKDTMRTRLEVSQGLLELYYPKIVQKLSPKTTNQSRLIIATDDFVDIARFFDPDKIRTVLNETKGLKRVGGDSQRPSELEEFLAGGSTIVSQQCARQLETTLIRVTADLIDGVCWSETLLSDLVIINLPLLQMKIDMDNERLSGIFGFSEEFCAAQILSMPELKWFSEMSILDLVRFREGNGFDHIRQVFRKQNNRLRYAAVADFGAIASSVEEDLRRMMAEHQRELEIDRQQIRKKMRRDLLTLSASLVLAIVTAPLPVLGLPLSIASILYGTPSARDLASMRKKLNSLQEKPRGLGVLEKYVKKDD